MVLVSQLLRSYLLESNIRGLVLEVGSDHHQDQGESFKTFAFRSDTHCRLCRLRSVSLPVLRLVSDYVKFHSVMIMMVAAIVSQDKRHISLSHGPTWLTHH